MYVFGCIPILKKNTMSYLIVKVMQEKIQDVPVQSFHSTQIVLKIVSFILVKTQGVPVVMIL